MRTIPFRQLVIPDHCEPRPIGDERLQALARRIQTEGLNYPPVVRADADGSYMLLVGARRAKALRLLAGRGEVLSCFGVPVPRGCIPVIELSDLVLHDDGDTSSESPREGGLTWRQKVAAIAEFRQLRFVEGSRVGRYPKTEETVMEIKGASQSPSEIEVQYISRSVILAHHLNNPDIAQAQSLCEAYETLYRKSVERLAVSGEVVSPAPMSAAAPTAPERPTSLLPDKPLVSRVVNATRRSRRPALRPWTNEESSEANYYSQRFPEHLRLFSKSLDDKGSCSRSRCHQREDFWGLRMGSFLSADMAEYGLCFSVADLWIEAGQFPNHLADIPPDDLPNFLCALFYLIFIDQVMYAHHWQAYPRFNIMMPCPKMDITIGWSRPMMMANPYEVFSNRVLDPREIRFSQMAECFKRWADFAVKDMMALLERRAIHLTWDDLKASILNDRDCAYSRFGDVFIHRLRQA